VWEVWRASGPRGGRPAPRPAGCRSRRATRPSWAT
jgi:hypothetical protein